MRTPTSCVRVRGGTGIDEEPRQEVVVLNESLDIRRGHELGTVTPMKSLLNKPVENNDQPVELQNSLADALDIAKAPPPKLRADPDRGWGAGAAPEGSPQQRTMWSPRGNRNTLRSTPLNKELSGHQDDRNQRKAFAAVWWSTPKCFANPADASAAGVHGAADAGDELVDRDHKGV